MVPLGIMPQIFLMLVAPLFKILNLVSCSKFLRSFIGFYDSLNNL